MFLLSKILLFLLNPLFWVFVLLLWGWLTKKPVRKKYCRVTAIVILLFFSNPFIMNHIMVAYETPKKELAENEQYSTGILLGGFIGFDARGKGVFNEASERLLQALQLYKSGHIQKIMVSGGSGALLRPGYREADFTRETLLQLGVPDSNIMIERNSRNTFENAIYTRRILDSLGMKGPSLLITSAWHMPRATAVFKKAGVVVVPYPCDFKHSITLDPDDVLIPSAGAMARWSILLKEWIGLLVYKLTAKL